MFCDVHVHSSRLPRHSTPFLNFFYCNAEENIAISLCYIACFCYFKISKQGHTLERELRSVTNPVELFAVTNVEKTQIQTRC